MEANEIQKVLLNIMAWTATANGSVESAEEALAVIRKTAQTALLNEGIVALDAENERPVCLGCGFDFEDAEIEVQEGCKCRNCGRTIHIVGEADIET
jgi:hypothetical protein